MDTSLAAKKLEALLSARIGKMLCETCQKPLGNGPRYIVGSAHYHLINCWLYESPLGR